MAERRVVIQRGYRITEEQANMILKNNSEKWYLNYSNIYIKDPEYLLSYRIDLDDLIILNNNHYYTIQDLEDSDLKNCLFPAAEETVTKIAKKYGITEPIKTYIGVEVYY
jgi:hypothetical protein